MDAEVKNEKVADDGQMPLLIEPKEEKDESVELIKPKVELIDEMDVKKEEIDDKEYQHIIPYEYRDYLEQHTEEEQPRNSRKRPANDVSISNRNTIKCLKCGKEISLSTATSRHVRRHAGLKKYECPANRCSFKDYDRSHVTVHMKRKHKSCTDPVIKNEISNEERQVLKDLTLECFPDLRKGKIRNHVICQLCHRSVKNCEQDKIEHSNGHIDPILFKCNEQNCDFSTNHFQYFARHAFLKHRKRFDSSDIKLQLLKEKVEIQKWTDMCFLKKCQLKKQKLMIQKWNNVCSSNKEKNPVKTVDYPAPVVMKLVVKQQYTCQICKKAITEDKVLFNIRRDHASEHVDFALYKCSVPSCQFQTKCLFALNRHQMTCHGLPFESSGIKIKLTTAQMADEIERMLSRCFPETA